MATEPNATGTDRPARGTRIAYIVSRFPVTTETFIMRELNEVAARPGVHADLYSLFPAPGGAVHEAARPWLVRVRRANPLRALASVLWWLVRRPTALVSTFALVIADYARDPALLGRALVATAAACEQARTVAAQRTDRVHAHFATYPALAAWVCWRLCGAPFSFTAHAHDLYVHKMGLARRIRDADFVVAISEHNRRLMRSLGATDTPIHVIHCGIDLGAYRYAPRVPPADGEVRALMVASLEPKKGHRFLFDALAGHPGLERVSLDLVGGGDLLPALKAQVERLGLAERVRFLGSRPEHEVADLLARADLFVLPSIVLPSGDTEGIPVALMEAMASGVPVVSSRVSGIPELVQDGETGLLAEPGDVAGLAEALARTIDRPEETRRRVDAARALVEEQFDLHACTAQLAGHLGVEPTEPEPALNGNRSPSRSGARECVPTLVSTRPPLVLAYHALGYAPPDHDPDGLVLPPGELRFQVESLLGRGYDFVTAAEFACRLRAGEDLQGVCALTFDDGSLDNASVLPEVLGPLGVPATLFICPGLLGVPHPWLEPESGVRLMDRDELLETAKLDFIEIGSHTVRHANLADAGEEEAYREMASSKEALEDLLGRAVVSFAYPYGHYSPACPAAAERAGYTSAATCGMRGSWAPFELQRELIAPGDWRLRFALKSRGVFRPLMDSPPMRLRRRVLGRSYRPSEARQGSVGAA
jgi:glycosyltransferase involved in cell wall biosynthesis/peptidoglycan/xylan/chitin deacetylase (PgdA/CDA1 family)